MEVRTLESSLSRNRGGEFMMPTSERTLQTLLVQAGFKQDDRLTPGLIGPSEVESDPDIYIRYGPLLAATPEGTPFGDFVYEVPSDIEGVAGTPCICFKVLDQATPAAINSVRVQVWNHGRVPTLWIITPDSVRIYDSFARPQAEDQSDSSNHLLEELTRIGNRLQGIDDFHKSKFDTGAFWQSGKGRDIQPEQRVDSALLRDLLDTREALKSKDLDEDVAQALLGRAIFVKYLEDRHILRQFHFQAHGNSNNFSDVLSDITSTYNFFDWLRETFNGDLFPVSQEEKDSVLEIHLGILRLFLAGHDMGSYPTSQARLWPYSFETIPIELISSIYEMFAHASNQEAAETTSIHYTRFNLVELVLGLAMRGMPHTAKVLDPACGSGVFLVEAFRRLARLKGKYHGRTLTREELHELLVSQIFGMDIDRQAVYVAAFSLYLALLELDPDPQPPDALRLPRLLESEGSDEGGKNLYVQDFFNPESKFNQTPPFSDRGFDLIVGNPPWTALTANLPGDSDVASPRQWGIEYCKRHDVPDNKPDQAFAWRAREFCGPGTKVALVVGSRLFFQRSEKAERWRRKFLESNQVFNVVNLSDLRNEHLLFGRGSSTSQPASVITFSPRPPDEHATVLHVAPKWYPGIRQRDELVVNSVDIQGIPQALFQKYEFLWKTAFRGTPRDFRFLQRLHSFPTLEDVLLQANVRKRLDRSYGLTFGSNPTKDASNLNGLPYLSAVITTQSTG
ncbi:MAG: N-6 DNA methylase, partial [Rhodothermaceae bacterium]|nr:N-6 DNA methylase [Rhodothermaceae bacterium]